MERSEGGRKGWKEGRVEGRGGREDGRNEGMEGRKEWKVGVMLKSIVL